MNKILYVLPFAISLLCCKKELPKDYVILSGTIKNQKLDSLIVYDFSKNNALVKKISVTVDGVFSDTLKLKPAIYHLSFGKERVAMYLKNGYNIHISADANKFRETFKFSGDGIASNNYLLQKESIIPEFMSNDSVLYLDKNDFKKKLNNSIYKSKNLLLLSKMASDFVSKEEEDLERLKKYITNYYEKHRTIRKLKGRDSPEFINYENYHGGYTSLSDFKGKYVYIDLWATWCRPCKKEIPYLQEIEKKYHKKNIVFISISIESLKTYDAWRNMVKEKNLSGIQLFAKEDKSFTDAYKVDGIPRFILIDPKGKVVSADAPRPSSDELTKLLEELNI
ncbi:TlpA family protein disulfide reductase [Flavobacteriaceae bacterium F08102]|nr:TlpA family protein disulfide reductase [Flavobacteriaceae bacterium F08102]